MNTEFDRCELARADDDRVGKLPLKERISKARAGDSESAKSLLSEFVAVVNEHRRADKEGFLKLQCGPHVHVDPLLADYLTACLAPLCTSEKNERGRRISADDALNLIGEKKLVNGESKGKPGVKARNLWLKSLRRGKEVADLFLGLPANKNMALYRGLPALHSSAAAARDSVSGIADPRLREAITTIAKKYSRSEFETINDYATWRRVCRKPELAKAST